MLNIIIVDPIILPNVNEIMGGTAFGPNLLGRQVEIKIRGKWKTGILTEYLNPSEINEDDEKARFVVDYDYIFSYDNNSTKINLRLSLLDGALRISDFGHVLRHLRECLSTPALVAPPVPAQAARSMPSGV